MLRPILFRPDDDGLSAGGGGAGTPERPEFIPEKFWDADKGEPRLEALAAWGGEAEKAVGRAQAEREQERQQFAQALEALEARAPATQQQQMGDDPLVRDYTRAIEEGDYGAMMRIQNEAASRQMLDAVGRVLDERMGALQPTMDATMAAQRDAQLRLAEDVVQGKIGAERYQALLPSITGILREKPHYLPAAGSVDAYAAAIMDVAAMAERDTLASQVTQLEAERQEKIAAQGLTGAGPRSVFTADEQKAEFDRVKNAQTGSYSELMRRTQQA